MGVPAKREIVLYAFPFSNLQGKKLRPCLVLSKKMYSDVLLCQISSQKRPKDEFVIELPKKSKGNTLHHDSYIRCNKLFTAKIDKIHLLCKITPEKYSQVTERITEMIT